jgi:hypothetical protein
VCVCYAWLSIGEDLPNSAQRTRQGIAIHRCSISKCKTRDDVHINVMEHYAKPCTSSLLCASLRITLGIAFTTHTSQIHHNSSYSTVRTHGTNKKNQSTGLRVREYLKGLLHEAASVIVMPAHSDSSQFPQQMHSSHCSHHQTLASHTIPAPRGLNHLRMSLHMHLGPL